MDVKKNVTNLLHTLRGERFNICGEIYEILKEQGNCQKGELLQFFLENSEGIKSSGEKEARHFLTEGKVIDYARSHGKIVDGILENLLVKKPCKEEFYEELWKKLTLDEVFENEEIQIFALYYIWIDIRIPYFDLPDTEKLEDEKYRQIIQKIRSRIQEARFILAADLGQRTQVSYHLLRLMDDMDYDEKAVFLSCIMQIRDKMIMRRVTEESGE